MTVVNHIEFKEPVDGITGAITCDIIRFDDKCNIVFIVAFIKETRVMPVSNIKSINIVTDLPKYLLNKFNKNN